ncbi:MAG: hypothetical protein ABMA14_09650 [Hyphomonadaceae bacterium]
MKNAILAGLVLVSPVLGTTAHAQQPELVIGFLDKNADGKCDLNEYLTYQLSRVPQFDKDADGELTQREFKDSLQGKAKSNSEFLFTQSNAGGGRTLKQQEFLGYQAWVFKTFIDTDHDGFMSQEEWTLLMKKAG